MHVVSTLDLFCHNFLLGQLLSYPADHYSISQHQMVLGCCQWWLPWWQGCVEVSAALRVVDGAERCRNWSEVMQLRQEVLLKTQFPRKLPSLPSLPPFLLLCKQYWYYFGKEWAMAAVLVKKSTYLVLHGTFYRNSIITERVPYFTTKYFWRYWVKLLCQLGPDGVCSASASSQHEIWYQGTEYTGICFGIQYGV